MPDSFQRDQPSMMGNSNRCPGERTLVDAGLQNGKRALELLVLAVVCVGK
jgi:hypothetical protein